MSSVPRPTNETVLSYRPGSAERLALEQELERQRQAPVTVRLRMGEVRRGGGPEHRIAAPHDHGLVLGVYSEASDDDVETALAAARSARNDWAERPLPERARVFLKAAALLAGSHRQRLNAATMLGQSKTAHQAEIDAACELIDFFRFNAWFAAELAAAQPISTSTEHNRLDLRPLDGFVYAVTPFNFTSIAGNLPTAPALLGNTVIWKPSPHAVLAAHHVMVLLEAAGLPPGVINLVPGDAARITERVLEQPDFAGLHFTGSTAVFQQLWRKTAEHLPRYHAYPRLVGETGGKGFVFAHPSADLTTLAVAIVRGAFEYQGQKCSAASRLYVPRSLWPRLEAELRRLIAELTLGDPTDFRHFLGAVIGAQAFERIRGYLELARADPTCRIVAGGGAEATRGYFIQPTLVETRDPRHRLMTEEIFGPVITVWVYDDDRLDQALALCDESRYALTGAIFCDSPPETERLLSRLRRAAGNVYVNDKPTGAVVGQQPFGGSRLSGTNDKAGSAWNLMRWASPRIIKENYDPPRDFRYPFLA